jgi:hypothetical protein
MSLDVIRRKVHEKLKGFFVRGKKHRALWKRGT